MLDQSPRRCAAVGIIAEAVVGRDRDLVPCQEPKKNSRLRSIGPPTDAPYWFRFSQSSAVPKKFLAFNSPLRKYSKNAPWKLFVPERVMMLTTPPPRPPNLAL